MAAEGWLDQRTIVAHFPGTVQEQILQQGYVDQGTCSMSTNRDVAVYYATGGGSRSAGVVNVPRRGMFLNRPD